MDKTKPRVLKSLESIDEINSKAQERLHKRRLSDLRKYNYLFGAEKQYKSPYKRVVFTIHKEAVPHF